MAGPEHALQALSDVLRTDGSVVSEHLVEPDPRAEPALGLVAACGPRAAAARADYALIVEAVREGYLLHYGEPRLVAGEDRDLALLAGDYLYAIALERLAGLGDADAIVELSDLISLAAQIHDGSREGARVGEEADALWLATAAAIGAGARRAHSEAKATLRAGMPEAAERLWAAALTVAAEAGFDEQVRAAAQAIDFAADFTSSSG